MDTSRQNLARVEALLLVYFSAPPRFPPAWEGMPRPCSLDLRFSSRGANILPGNASNKV